MHLPVQGVGREWSGESGGVDGGALGSNSEVVMAAGVAVDW